MHLKGGFYKDDVLATLNSDAAVIDGRATIFVYPEAELAEGIQVQARYMVGEGSEVINVTDDADK
jgi:hypothetical protein